MRVAAVTMSYNEGERLPIWVRHCGRQVGPENCYVIDHGSSDGSIQELKQSCPQEASRINIVKLPRGSIDEQIRARAIGHFSSFLLRYYDWVAHSDVDELLVADPRRYESLVHYCRELQHQHVTAIGLDVIHKGDLEEDLRTDGALGEQRSFARFSSSMCKQSLISGDTTWSKGFHTSDKPSNFGDLFLFHLRFSDLRLGLARLAITQDIGWSSPQENMHQRISCSEFLSMIRSQASLPVLDDEAFSAKRGLISTYVQQVKQSESGPEPDGTYRVNLHIFGQELVRIPSVFKLVL